MPSACRQVALFLDSHPIPLDTTFEITSRCNLRCSHCYNFDRRATDAAPVPAPDLLSDADIHRIIAELDAANCLTITFSGGEPLLREGLVEFVAQTRQLHMGAYLKTNATLLTARRAGELAAARLMGMEVSVYGANAATHDTVTGVPGSFFATLDGIRHAVEAGLKPHLSFTLMRQNFSERHSLITLADGLGLSYTLDAALTARYDGTRSFLGERLTQGQLEELYTGPDAPALPAPDFSTPGSVQCGCARLVAGIGADGTVFPCIGAPLAAGSLREKSFGEIWNTADVFRHIRGLQLEDFPACRDCADRPWCRRSSGAVYVNTGDYTGAEPWTCMEARVLRKLEESEGVSNS